jgi:hypothetical protein
MTEKDCTQQAKKAALEHGADLVGIVKVEDLPEHRERFERMVPGARSVLVIATGHSLASLRSGANELAQFDTIPAYNECARASHAAARLLESRGFFSTGVSAFIPLDMDEPGKGMRGEICWQRPVSVLAWGHTANPVPWSLKNMAKPFGCPVQLRLPIYPRTLL